MSTFSKQKLLKASVAQIPDMSESIRQEFLKDNFEVNVDPLVNGGSDISIAKGGGFKSILGMRSALKVTLTPQIDGVNFDAHVGIFGQQLLPTIISMFFYWPVLITQIWGLVRQSKLDDRALAAAERAISCVPSDTVQHFSSAGVQFCTKCGAKMPTDADFCSKCGNKLN